MSNDFKGTNAELDHILDGFWWNSRVWEAWQVGTMTQDDFQPAAETEIVGDLIAWRDAAVAAAATGAEDAAGELTARHGGRPIDPRRNYP